jgi:hypothetical protein
MAGDYPSTDFAISEDGVVRRVVHMPSGMTIVTTRVLRDPVAVSSAYTIEAEGYGSQHPQEVAQAALRHLRVWLMRTGPWRRVYAGRTRLAPPRPTIASGAAIARLLKRRRYRQVVLDLIFRFSAALLARRLGHGCLKRVRLTRSPWAFEGLFTAHRRPSTRRTEGRLFPLLRHSRR